MSGEPERGRLLAPLTTLQLGGPARYFVEGDTRARLLDALRWAKSANERVGILGGGSNLVVADEGFSGLVLHVATRGIELERGDVHTRVTVQAGQPWDDVVELAVHEQLAGIECLTGIPGSTGATPIQNVGAYGQEVADVIEAVEVFDRVDETMRWLSPQQCGFSYRASRFKREPERHLVLSVRFSLRTHGQPQLRYGELSRALASRAQPSLRDVCDHVRVLRSSKGMLIDASFEPSAGSFFTNPIISAEQADAVTQLALARGMADAAEELPRFADPQGVKLSAAWLIEHAGIAKGAQHGKVGVSCKHALALVNYGGTSRELLAFAREIQQQVEHVFGVALEIEPVRWSG